MPPPSKKPQTEKLHNQQQQPLITDVRFSHIHNDPRYIRPKKKDNKVVIDKRFAPMLDKKFSGTPGVTDKYGRKISSKKGAEDLKRFYRLEEEEGVQNEESKKDTAAKGNVVSESKTEESEAETDDESVAVSSNEEEEEEEEVEEEEEEEDEDDDDKQPEYDPSRGEGLVSSSSESDSDSDASDVEETGDDEEEEEDDAVPLGEETCRFAVMNMDWDKVKSIDLYTVFNGFKPTNGVIKSVKVYPSEFGKERIEKEEREGPPKDIFKDGGEESDDEPIYEDDGDDDDEQLIKEDTGEEFDMVKLRKYQLERLRYYYAVVECDSIETASAIYRACDGAEYESSANFFDLRFVPDGMTFDDPPRDVATDVPEHYRPRDFSTDVLQHSKVKLTWDDDDVDRVAVTRRALSKEEIKNMDFSAYLAESSDEGDGDSDDDIETTRKKYRSLLAEIHGDDGDEEEEKGEGEMEITFAPGLSEAASALLKKKKEEEDLENETTLQAYVRKQKEKRQRKKTDKSVAKSANGEGEGEGESLFSDDDVAVDMDDPYFAEEKGTANADSSKKSKKTNKKDRKPTLEERAESDRQRRELELLVLGDEEGGRDHFNLKDVVKSEKLTNRKKSRLEKKKGRKGEDEGETQDGFRIDTKDTRFSALHSSHHFAIDPTNPAFKKTAAMKELMTERQKSQRRKTDREEGSVVSSERKKEQSGNGESGSLAKLVESVKRKSAHFATQKGDGKRSKLN